MYFVSAICRRPPVCRLSVCLSVVCRLSVKFVHPTQAIEIFVNVSTLFGTLATHWHPGKILRRSSEGTPPAGELNTTGVSEYNDFGHIERYISETVQDRS